MVLHSLLIQGDPGKNDVTHFPTEDMLTEAVFKGAGSKANQNCESHGKTTVRDIPLPPPAPLYQVIELPGSS